MCALSTLSRISVDVMNPLNAGTGIETWRALFLERNYNKQLQIIANKNYIKPI